MRLDFLNGRRPIAGKLDISHRRSYPLEMKNRIGVITTSREAFAKISGSFPEAHFHFASNVLQFHQMIGSQKPGLMVFHALDASTEADLVASIRFLRGKSGFQSIPFLILHVEKVFRVKMPFVDPALRSFQINESLFVKLLDFYANLNSPDYFAQKFKLSPETLEKSFQHALRSRLNIKGDFTVRSATDDEMHTRFFCQQSGEVSTSLFWAKYTGRLLEEGNPVLVEMFKSFTGNEKEEMMEKLLAKIMKDLTNEVENQLDEVGALSFLNSEDLAYELRKPFLKSAVNRALIFETNTCRVVLEYTQYI